MTLEMNDMIQSQKAKRYDEALEKAKSWYADAQIDFKKSLETLFPELKESEDENIRKDCIKYLDWEYKHCSLDKDRMKIEKCIVWLENQGQVEPKFKVGDIITPKDGGHEPWQIMQVDILDKKYIFKDGYVIHFSQEDNYELVEQKTAEKPKFKVGDWVVDKNGTVQQILSYKDCIYKHTNGYSSKMFEDVWRMWDIAKDAKDGDVLAFDDETIVIFKDLYNTTTFHSYCHIEEGVFSISQDDMPDWWEGKGFHPATKEQCDLLFSKMREAGYEWDSNKKELNKVKQAYKIIKGKNYFCVKTHNYAGVEWIKGTKYYASDNYTLVNQGCEYYCPEYSKEEHNNLFEEVKYNGCVEKQDEQKPTEWSSRDDSYFEELTEASGLNELQIEWLTEIKDRVLRQPKQEWSEEDENRINRLISYFKDKESFTAEDDVMYANWLKSLRSRNRWKPSDEQIYWLRWTIGRLPDTEKANEAEAVLKELLEDLKKLMEE